MTKITRRQALKTGIAGAAFVAVGAPAASAATSAFGAGETLKSKCATMHPLIGQNLAMYCDDASVSVEAKNHALKSATCPHCNVGIAPFGDSVNFVRL